MRPLVTLPPGSWQALPTRRQAAAQEHLAIASTMYRSVETIFWLQQTEVESNELGWIPRRAESFSMGEAPAICGFRHLSCGGWNRRGLLGASRPSWRNAMSALLQNRTTTPQPFLTHIHRPAEWASCNAAIGRAGFAQFLRLSAVAQGTYSVAWGGAHGQAALEISH